jgi:transposase
MAPGSGSMTSCAAGGGCTSVVMPSPVRASSTASRSRPRKGGRSRVRCGQEGDRPQASSAGGHRQPGDPRGGAVGGHPGRRWRHRSLDAGPPGVSAAGADMSGWGVRRMHRRVDAGAVWLAAGDREQPPRQAGLPGLAAMLGVERTLGWLGRNRRLSKDYEEYAETSEAWLYLACIRLSLRRRVR